MKSAILSKTNILPSGKTLKLFVKNVVRGAKSTAREIAKKAKTLEKKNIKGFINSKLVIAVLVIGLGALSFLGVRKIVNRSSDDRVSVKKPIAVQELNKRFDFPLRDADGEEVGKFGFLIESAEIRNEVIVQGQKRSSIQGRTLLVLNIKIINDIDQSIKVDTRDYVRLSVNENMDEWLAPDLHNDPVDVQSISTKPTRLAFPIGEDDTNHTLQIGEIGGDKETIALELD